MPEPDQQVLKSLAERLLSDPESATLLNRMIDQTAGQRAAQRERARRPERLAMLRDRRRQYDEVEAFSPGEVVVWKPGMKNRNMPDYDVPVVVVEVLDPPVIDNEKGSGSAYFREPLSLRLGLIDDDEDFVTYHYDGRRFTHFHDA